MHETDLRWRLRRLPAEIEPPRDLWAGIAGRIERPARRRRPTWLAGLALAASVCVAVGLAWSLRAPDPLLPAQTAQAVPDLPSGRSAPAEGVRREADALTREYYAALREFDGAPMPVPLEPALATLDRSASDLRGALASDPGAVFLLDQLRRTYARRLSLTQRAATG